MMAQDANVRETHALIASDKVEGTRVYSLAGEHIGSIKRIVVDKVSGQVAYAVLAFGGFLGIGDDYYPLPWGKLKYDQELGGYRVDVSKEQLEGAPEYNDEDEDWSPTYGRSIYDYYGISPYWV